MKSGLLCLFLLMATVNAYGEDLPNDTAANQSSNTQSPEDSESKPVESPTAPPKEIWPKPFIPSERIGADSVVSFPVDI